MADYIEIEMPDNTVLEFPKSMSEADMQRAAASWWAENAPKQDAVAPEQAKPQESGGGFAAFSDAAGDAAREFGFGGLVSHDMAKQAGVGAVEGAAGLLDLATAPFRSAYNRVGALAGGADESELWSGVPGAGLDAVSGPAQDIAEPITSIQPETRKGEYARTAGNFAPGAALAGGGGVANLVRNAAVPAIASEAAGAATEGTEFEGAARVGAAVMAPAGASILQRIISPFGGVSKSRLALAKVLDDHGVPISSGQRTGAEGLRRLEGQSAMGANLTDKQATSFTRAALRTIGETADEASPEVLSRAAKRIGSQFDDILGDVSIVPDRGSLVKMSNALRTFKEMAPKNSAPPLFKNINKKMLDAAVRGDPIPANTLKTWRSNISKLTRSNDAATRDAAIEALDVLDDTIGSGLKAAGKQSSIEGLNTAREQWRNLIAIETAASRAGEKTAVGVLSPSALRNSVVQQGRRSYVRGTRGDLGDLARAAEGVMKPLPTVEAGGLRSARGMPEILGGSIGAGVTGGSPLGMAAGVAAPTLAREGASIPAVQKYLANQMVNPGRMAEQGNLGVLLGLAADQQN